MILDTGTRCPRCFTGVPEQGSRKFDREMWTNHMCKPSDHEAWVSIRDPPASCCTFPARKDLVVDWMTGLHQVRYLYFTGVIKYLLQEVSLHLVAMSGESAG